MAKLIYFMPTSLDGYIADDCNFDWSTPSEEAFAIITDLHRPIGTYLHGRKEYETMAVWETPEVIPGFTLAMLDFARIWQASDKIVYSKSWETVFTPKTRGQVGDIGNNTAADCEQIQRRLLVLNRQRLPHRLEVRTSESVMTAMSANLFSLFTGYESPPRKFTALPNLSEKTANAQAPNINRTPVRGSGVSTQPHVVHC
jgi:hypothetical protein